MTDIIQELRGLIAKGVPESDSGWYISNTTGSGLSIIEDGLMFPGSGICPIKCETPQADLIVAAINHLPALLDRLEAAERGWQPIETAPRDGTTIDVWRDGTRETVYWGLPPHCCGEMGQYCDSDWHGIKNPGWICSTFGEFVGGKHDPFTHWRPLPEAPAIDAALVGEG